MRIELTTSVWKTEVLPLNYTRIYLILSVSIWHFNILSFIFFFVKFFLEKLLIFLSHKDFFILAFLLVFVNNFCCIFRKNLTFCFLKDIIVRFSFRKDFYYSSTTLFRCQYKMKKKVQNLLFFHSWTFFFYKNVIKLKML